jgi:hypothetical protein
VTAGIAGLANLALALAYLTIGTLIAIDLQRDIRRRGWSHFGVAWLTIMYTCGGHHLVHGIHLTGEGRPIGWVDIAGVALGLPAGAIFSWLRIEASTGGRGDRMVPRTPLWLQGAALVVACARALATGPVTADPRLLPNVLLVGLYVAIGGILWRGQRRNRAAFGGWSISGLSLMLIFPTCAVMHGVYVVYAATGTFAPDFHGLWVDWLSVPAAAWFLWVVRGLERGTVRDWNRRFEAIQDLALPRAAGDGSAEEAPALAG